MAENSSIILKFQGGFLALDFLADLVATISGSVIGGARPGPGLFVGWIPEAPIGEDWGESMNLWVASRRRNRVAPICAGFVELPE